MKAPARSRTSFDAPLAAWFAEQGWTPAPFQRAAWKHYLANRDGLLVTPTGSGKTLAAFGGPLLQALRDPPSPRAKRGQAAAPRTRVLWITPLRALANDTTRALRTPIEALGLPWTVAMRTGDASTRDKRLARHTNLASARTPSRLELTYLQAADAPTARSGAARGTISTM